MGSPYTIVAISDIPLSDAVEDLFSGKRGRRLTEPALVEIDRRIYRSSFCR